jgi:GntR family transcriptional regulator, arabinose operon transcriptional repressor
MAGQRADTVNQRSPKRSPDKQACSSQSNIMTQKDPLNKEHPTTPLYIRTYELLKEKILAGEWSYGAMLPSEIELCEIYRISRGTIRLALAELENEKLVSRQRGRGTFITYSRLKRQPREFNNHTISFIVPYVRDSFVASILLGLEREARLSRYAVVFSHFENDPEKQELALKTAIGQHVSGIVLYPVNSDTLSPTLVELHEKQFPLVLVDRYLRNLDLDYVTSDNFSGGLIATQHLLSLGHQGVGFLSWTEGATSIIHRQAGYRQALLEAGIELEPGMEWEVKGYPEVDQNTLERHLTQSNRPTAIFAANDQLAIAVMQAARAVRLAIPSELALVGFDNLDISAHLDVPLTTIAQPAFEMGRTAWHLLNRKFSSVDSCTEKHVLPVQLIVRQSSGVSKLLRKEVMKDKIMTST